MMVLISFGDENLDLLSIKIQGKMGDQNKEERIKNKEKNIEINGHKTERDGN